jgi:hypothetical protein
VSGFEKFIHHRTVNVVEPAERKLDIESIVGIVRSFHGMIPISMLFYAKRQAVPSHIVPHMVLMPSWIDPDVSK